MKRLNGPPLAALLAVMLMLTAFLSACSTQEAGSAGAGEGQDAAPAGTKKLLLLKKKEGSGDPVLISHLEKLGYLVMDMSENEFTAQAAKDYAVIYVSDSVNAARVDSGLKDVAAGIIYAKPQLAETAGLTEPLSYGHLTGEKSVRLVQPKHPLAAGLSGDPAVYAASGRMGYAAPGKEAAVIAAAPGDEKKALVFAYEKGAKGAGGQTLPGRRVFFYMPTGEEENQSEDGWKLLDAAIVWAAQNPKP
ncbi:hypothetical protein ACVNS2_21485 [Paenibacillus caseinilyticus]|uniref:Membrane protein n=1 Tax=Paenibacillus mucilaginosus K02 TaxID=997761 RepID=I0BLJ0_9BACL|nr:hypothetical protein [Paenibacillus mucilaginosus]AFH63237.1 membrane protein [Paenibacillus mucilaginosus K02]